MLFSDNRCKNLEDKFSSLYMPQYEETCRFINTTSSPTFLLVSSPTAWTIDSMTDRMIWTPRMTTEPDNMAELYDRFGFAKNATTEY